MSSMKVKHTCLSGLCLHGRPSARAGESRVSRVPRDTTIVNHSRNGSYGESSLEAHIWPEDEEVVQANRRCQDMEYT